MTNQIYVGIVFIVCCLQYIECSTSFAGGVATCPKKWKKKGCYSKGSIDTSNMLLSWRSDLKWDKVGFTKFIEKLACTCAREARKLNQAGFALFWYGQCFPVTKKEIAALGSGDKADKCYKLDGKFQSCTDTAGDAPCVGDASALYIYSMEPIDGEFSDWGAWSTCSTKCGPGSRSRIRQCNNPEPALGGKDCKGNSQENEACNSKPCAVDGGFGDWGAWTTCSKSCGGGLHQRSRACNNPTPSYNGKPCSGRSSETAKCGTNACPAPVLVNLGQTYRFVSKNYPSRMMRHRSFQVWLDPRVNQALYKVDSSFTIIPGLAGRGITFKSLNYPNRFIRHRGWLCYIDTNDGSQLFKVDASFMPRKGLAGTRGSVSFESVNYPGFYIRHAGFRVRVNKNNNSPLFKDDATWIPNPAPAILPPAVVKVGQTYRFKSKNYPGRMMRHRSFRLWLDPSINQALYRVDSSFTIIPGLAGIGITFKSRNFPNRFIRHRGWLCYLDANDGSQLFRKDASFIPRNGLAGTPGSVSFESVNYPGYYMRHAGFRVRVNRNDNSRLFKDDATWIPTH